MEEKILQQIADKLTINNALLEEQNVRLSAILQVGLALLDIQGMPDPADIYCAHKKKRAADTIKDLNELLGNSGPDGKSQAERTAEKLGNA